MVESNLLCFVALFFFSATSQSEVINITASNGDTVFLPCPVFPLHSSDNLTTVNWIKDKHVLCTYLIERQGIRNVKCIPRFNISFKYTGMYIANLTSHDSGVYKCSMTTIIPPPMLEESSVIKLQVTGLILRQINSSDPSCVELLCLWDDLIPNEVNFTWTSAGQQRLPAPSEVDATQNSTVRLCKPDWRDGDTVTCNASVSSDHYSRSITLTFNSGGHEFTWLIIISVCSCVGLMLIISLVVLIYKCKKKKAKNHGMVITNKVYENFSFSNVVPNPASTFGSNMTPSNTRVNPQHQQREDCIYEN